MGKNHKINEFLVNRVPGIRDRYRKLTDGQAGKAKAAACLLWYNFSYYVLGNKKLGTPEKYPYYEDKELCANASESSLSKKGSPEDFAKKLLEFDVVSFDVFDTLIFRPFSCPDDLFYIMGDRLAYPDFKNIRSDIEAKARKIKYEEKGRTEVTIEEIYALLEDETGLKGEGGRPLYETEIAIEEEFAFANPYMISVVNALKKAGKRMIITSDMYLHTEHIERLLSKCGYPKFDAYYISCETTLSKSRGDVYTYIRDVEGATYSFAHIGDDPVCDEERAKERGFIPFLSKNPNTAGRPYRPEDMSVITGSVYRGLVNAHIHNGLNSFSREYEYGYIYGGLFVTGYCRFIHDFAKKNSIDTLLFLSRDGDVLLKAYNLLYPEETNTEYVYWSRLAACKLTAGHFRHDFFRRFLYQKVDQDISLWMIFASMDLSDMLTPFCDEYNEGLEERTYLPDTVLTNKNAEDVKTYLCAHWEEALKIYEAQSAAAKAYYAPILSGAKSAAAIDIGWAGSGAITLDYMVNSVWGLDCPITGIVAGTNTCSSSECDLSETFLQSGKLVSYLFSQRENRDIWKFHDPQKGHNIYLETLLDAPAGSLRGFYPAQDGAVEIALKHDGNDPDKVLMIQQGILDFAAQWKDISEKLGPLDNISGRDAYAPFMIMESEKNRAFMKELMPGMYDMGV